MGARSFCWFRLELLEKQILSMVFNVYSTFTPWETELLYLESNLGEIMVSDYSRRLNPITVAPTPTLALVPRREPRNIIGYMVLDNICALALLPIQSTTNMLARVIGNMSRRRHTVDISARYLGLQRHARWRQLHAREQL